MSNTNNYSKSKYIIIHSFKINDYENDKNRLICKNSFCYIFKLYVGFNSTDNNFA